MESTASMELAIPTLPKCCHRLLSKSSALFLGHVQPPPGLTCCVLSVWQHIISAFHSETSYTEHRICESYKSFHLRSLKLQQQQQIHALINKCIICAWPLLKGKLENYRLYLRLQGWGKQLCKLNALLLKMSSCMNFINSKAKNEVTILKSLEGIP